MSGDAIGAGIVTDVLVVETLTGLAVRFLDDGARSDDVEVIVDAGAVVDGHTGGLVTPERAPGAALLAASIGQF